MSVWSPRRLVLMHLPEKCHVLQHSSRSKDGKQPPIISTTQRNSFSSSYQFVPEFQRFVLYVLYWCKIVLEKSWDLGYPFCCSCRLFFMLVNLNHKNEFQKLIPKEFLQKSFRAVLLSFFLLLFILHIQVETKSELITSRQNCNIYLPEFF